MPVRFASTPVAFTPEARVPFRSDTCYGKCKYDNKDIPDCCKLNLPIGLPRRHCPNAITAWAKRPASQKQKTRSGINAFRWCVYVIGLGNRCRYAQIEPKENTSNYN